MKQGRTPDRVHVVRPPQDDFRADDGAIPAPPRDGRGIELIRTLAQINDKLKRSEAERYELLAELREYRKSLNELEDKAEQSEKAYLALENKIKTRENVDTEISQRQARFERALKETENKLVQAAAGQALLDKRVKDTEDKGVTIIQRLDETVQLQARYDRQLERIGHDKARMLRKVERMEEILGETQDTLKARALVLLTDQSAAAQAAGLPQIPAYTSGETPANTNEPAAPWWRKSVRMQGVGMASMVVAALLFGWTINQIQQPDIPSIAVLENGGLARLDLETNRWEAINSAPAAPAPVITENADDTVAAIPSAGDEAGFAGLDNAETATAAEPALDATPAATQSAGTIQTPAAQDVLNASDDQLLAALEENPDALAAQLNEIAPAAQRELELDTPVTAPVQPGAEAMSAQATAAVTGDYNPLARFSTTAFMQEPALANKIAQERGRTPLAERMKADPQLPAAAKQLETQALSGVPEAQHDLAALYTAGRGQVGQNFEKAALWFRESADAGISNAAYNLGVLYHQGLGVEKDLDRALYWYREAAKQGHPEAQYNLGIAHIEGIGTKYDAPLAAAFFESAANQGIVEAAYNLGLIHENGLIDGTAKQEEAILWYKIAADGGNADAKAALQQMSSSMQIGMDELGKMADRMQAVYQGQNGRRAGKV